MILELCEALLAAYEQKGEDPRNELVPGLSPEEVRAKTAWFPAKLPGPLIELYGWRNGQPNDAWNTERILWFRDMQFTSLERAHHEYLSMVASYGVGNSREEEGIDLRTSFPFASFNGGWYVLACEGQDLDPRHAFPVVSVFQGIDVYFHSIERMLRTCIAWRLASTRKDDRWDLPVEAERRIWLEHNPGIFGTAT